MKKGMSLLAMLLITIWIVDGITAASRVQIDQLVSEEVSQEGKAEVIVLLKDESGENTQSVFGLPRISRIYTKIELPPESGQK